MKANHLPNMWPNRCTATEAVRGNVLGGYPGGPSALACPHFLQASTAKLDAWMRDSRYHGKAFISMPQTSVDVRSCLLSLRIDHRTRKIEAETADDLRRNNAVIL